MPNAGSTGGTSAKEGKIFDAGEDNSMSKLLRKAGERIVPERKYRNPPVIESLCELFFAESAWDDTVPGAFYEQVKHEFTKKQQREIQQAEIVLRNGICMMRIFLRIRGKTNAIFLVSGASDWKWAFLHQ